MRYSLLLFWGVLGFSLSTKAQQDPLYSQHQCTRQVINLVYPDVHSSSLGLGRLSVDYNLKRPVAQGLVRFSACGFLSGVEPGLLGWQDAFQQYF